VGTSTASSATYYPSQRKSFYANGRFWVFYFDGTNMVYRTSTDGSTWTSATTVKAVTAGNQFSIWFDGTYLHYVYAYASSLYYRRGTPNSNGSITWSATEQTVSTTYNYALYPVISTDSNGYVWIGYYEYTGTFYYPYIIKSGNNDGTWGSTPSGFPYQLSSTNAIWNVIPVPLTSGKMLVIYARTSASLTMQAWNGSAWGSAVTTVSTNQYYYSFSAVAQGDNAHIVFLKATTYDIVYTKYTYSTNSLSTETTLVSGATSTSAPVMSINPNTNDLYVFVATKTTGTPTGWTANHIYYTKYTDSTSTWGSWVDWINEATEVLTSEDVLTSFYQAYGNKIGLEYETKTASPYNVKFAFSSLSISQSFSSTLWASGSRSSSMNLYKSYISALWANGLRLSSMNLVRPYSASTFLLSLKSFGVTKVVPPAKLLSLSSLSNVTTRIKSFVSNLYKTGVSVVTRTVNRYFPTSLSISKFRSAVATVDRTFERWALYGVAQYDDDRYDTYERRQWPSIATVSSYTRSFVRLFSSSLYASTAFVKNLLIYIYSFLSIVLSTRLIKNIYKAFASNLRVIGSRVSNVTKAIFALLYTLSARQFVLSIVKKLTVSSYTISSLVKSITKQLASLLYILSVRQFILSAIKKLSSSLYVASAIAKNLSRYIYSSLYEGALISFIKNILKLLSSSMFVLSSKLTNITKLNLSRLYASSSRFFTLSVIRKPISSLFSSSSATKSYQLFKSFVSSLLSLSAISKSLTKSIVSSLYLQSVRTFVLNVIKKATSTLYSLSSLMKNYQLIRSLSSLLYLQAQSTITKNLVRFFSVLSYLSSSIRLGGSIYKYLTSELYTSSSKVMGIYKALMSSLLTTPIRVMGVGKAVSSALSITSVLSTFKSVFLSISSNLFALSKIAKNVTKIIYQNILNLVTGLRKDVEIYVDVDLFLSTISKTITAFTKALSSSLFALSSLGKIGTYFRSLSSTLIVQALRAITVFKALTSLLRISTAIATQSFKAIVLALTLFVSSSLSKVASVKKYLSQLLYTSISIGTFLGYQILLSVYLKVTSSLSKVATVIKKLSTILYAQSIISLTRVFYRFFTANLNIGISFVKNLFVYIYSRLNLNALVTNIISRIKSLVFNLAVIATKTFQMNITRAFTAKLYLSSVRQFIVSAIKQLTASLYALSVRKFVLSIIRKLDVPLYISAIGELRRTVIRTLSTNLYLSSVVLKTIGKYFYLSLHISSEIGKIISRIITSVLSMLSEFQFFWKLIYVKVVKISKLLQVESVSVEHLLNLEIQKLYKLLSITIIQNRKLQIITQSVKRLLNLIAKIADRV